jgi:CRP/FNR family transcriptional regulator, cyclic AMP receptor protein
MTPEILREIPLFATLNPEEIQDLLGRSEQKTYPPHAVIFWMDELGDKLYIIEKGQVRISQTNKEGKEHELAVLGERAFFGELSLLDGGPHSGTARTITETTVLTIDQSAFYSFLDRHPQFSRTLLAVMVDRLRFSADFMRLARTESYEPLPQPAAFRKFADRAARTIASSRFLIIVLIFLASWIGLQTWYYLKQHSSGINFADNPPTFFVLGFVLTVTSFLLTILVLTSQRRLAEQDRIRADIEYQVNLKAQAEIMRLQLKMDEVLKILEQKNKTTGN